MTLRTQTQRSLMLTAGLAGLLAVAGCHSSKPNTGDEFAPTDESASVRRIATIQQANAARTDGNLYDNHFDGVHLNSLGQSKLALMLKDGEKDWPLVVYMDVPEDGDYRDRLEAVAGYLRDVGLRDSQFKFMQGPNPHFTTLAAPNIQRVKDADGNTDANLSSRPGGGAPATPGNGSTAPAGGGAAGQFVPDTSSGSPLGNVGN